MKKVKVEYEHNPSDLADIEIAVTKFSKPSAEEWRPAYRDTEDGKRIVWAKFDVAAGVSDVYIRDRFSTRRVGRVSNG